jgi:hypothetical protein
MSKPTRPGRLIKVLRCADGSKLAEVYATTSWLRPRDFRYRILGGNNKIMAASEGYVTLSGAVEGVEDLMRRLDRSTLPTTWWENVA